MADIPGIIEGASEGKGLGLRFLRHIERNPVLLFMVPVDTKDIRKEYEILLNELSNYNPGLMRKRRVLAITKCDMLDEELLQELKKDLPDDLPTVMISSVTGLGIAQLKDLLWIEMNKEPDDDTEITHAPIPVDISDSDDFSDVDSENETDLDFDWDDEDEEDFSDIKGIGWDD
jgi:GTP-binding protein